MSDGRERKLMTRQKEEELNELREAFACFDKDSSGTITTEEIAHILQAMNKNVTQKQLEKMVERYDVNNDGEIDFEEFVLMMSLRDRNEGDELEDAFNVFDKNGDGLISSQELQIVMNALGENIAKDIADLMIASVDTDGNGEIDFDEFRVMMMDGAPILSPDESKMIKAHSRLSITSNPSNAKTVKPGRASLQRQKLPNMAEDGEEASAQRTSTKTTTPSLPALPTHNE